MLFPTSSRRQSGVVLVPQLKQTIAPIATLACLGAGAARAAAAADHRRELYARRC
jgi:hypothetical protein